MNRSLLLFALSVALSEPAFAATDDELQKALVGTWGDSADCTTGILVFNSDGSFSSRSGSDATDREDGTYKISGGHLMGSTSDREMPDVTIVYDGTSLYFQNEGGSKDQLFRCAK